ncbi:AKR_HP2_G0026970.mRNA.1.CDS.1 [Saccharomyces cerevisiae]|nr:AKR_HP2_G0026970.mRNA.1.CDS.1 [Saccharomyces cerevisiae]CAI6782911.1 AKR_HP2_G0026970.mRNA.1.CDS.1 [Saccharomyces cerevisiae]
MFASLISTGLRNLRPSAGINDGIGYCWRWLAAKYDWNEEKTFISRDSGLTTWRLVHNSTGLYTTGDLGNIIMYIPYRSNENGDVPSQHFIIPWIKLRHGVNMIRSCLFYPYRLVSTISDGSGSKFILTGTSITEDPIFITYSIDFSAVFDYKSCEEGDFEDWNLADGKCVNGAKYKYRRRKQDAQCLVKKAFKDLSLDETPCNSCTGSDYECSFEFVRDAKGDCIPDYNLIALSDICDKSKGKSVLVKPLQLIKGDKCKTPMKIEIRRHSIQLPDESLVTLNFDRETPISHDGGQTIKGLTLTAKIVEIVFNPYFNSSASFVWL